MGSSSSSSKSSSQSDERFGAEGSAVALRNPNSGGGDITISTNSDEVISDAFDFLTVAEAGNQSFASDALELIENFSSTAVQATQTSIGQLVGQSQQFAEDVIANQNPNDGNRIETVAIVAAVAVSAAFILGGKK